MHRVGQERRRRSGIPPRGQVYAIGEVCDLRPNRGARTLRRQLPDLTWERTDRADALRTAVGLR